MPRYIDADKLYEEMQYGILHEHYDKPFDLLAEILDAPSADVRENVKGSLIEPYWEEYFGTWYHCSVCGSNMQGGNFCSECGADMRGEEDGKIH